MIPAGVQQPWIGSLAEPGVECVKPSSATAPKFVIPTPSTSLIAGMAFEGRPLIDPLGHRVLQQDPGHSFVVGELTDLRQQLLGRGGRRHRHAQRLHPHFLAATPFHLHVGRRCGILSYQNGGQGRGGAGLLPDARATRPAHSSSTCAATFLPSSRIGSLMPEVYCAPAQRQSPSTKRPTPRTALPSFRPDLTSREAAKTRSEDIAPPTVSVAR